MIGISQFDNSLFELISETSENMYFFIAELKNDYSHWSRSSVEYFGLPGEYIENTAKVWSSYIHPDDRYIFLKDIKNILLGKSNKHDCEYRARNKYGKYVWVRCRGIVKKMEDGSPQLFIGTIMNLGQDSKFDHATGLFSFSELKRQLEYFLNKKHRGSLLLFDLDNFRRINDLLGYWVGDKILSRIADYFQQMSETNFYRIEGDKFCCILNNSAISHSNYVYDEVNKFIQSLPDEMKLQFKLSISCGVTNFPDDGNDVGTLFANAEYALEQAKSNGRGSIAYFSDKLHQKTINNFLLQEALQHAIANNYQGFSMFYQPLMYGSEDKVFGAEALMRFTFEDGTCISPMHFIPILEEDGEICKVGEWALRTALRQASDWRKIRPDFHISVNVSYIQVLKQGFTTIIDNALKESDFPPENLILELTESCKVSDPQYLCSAYDYLSAKKICMALDDFGTGYSSIALLRMLEPDLIKIDHTFVKSITESRMDQAILEYIMNLSKNSGIQVCVEGIENEEIRNFVQKFEPDLLQGYLFSKPCCADEFLNKYIK